VEPRKEEEEELDTLLLPIFKKELKSIKENVF
jgi:hypothetical protein